MELCKPNHISSSHRFQKHTAVLVLIILSLFLSSCSFGRIKLLGGIGKIDFDIDYPVGQITKDVVVSQDFVSNAPVISQIWLYGATYKRDNTATVDIRLYKDTVPSDLNEDGSGDGSLLLASWSLDSSEMEDNTIIKLDVPESEINTGLEGTRCLIVISSPDGEPEKSPTFWMTEEDVYEDGHLVINGYEQYNDLWFQVMGRK